MSGVQKELYITMRGANSEVGVRVPLEHFYRETMETVVIADSCDAFYSLVQCIIWGSLYIEALVNRVALDIFGEDRFGGSDSGELWALAEKAELENKLKVMAQRRKVPAAELEENLKKLRRIAKIRNRLVHYKERFTRVDASPLFKPLSKTFGELTREKLASITRGDVYRELEKDLADPDIVHAVKSVPLMERKMEIISLGEWVLTLRKSENTITSP